MPSTSLGTRRAFVRNQTRLVDVPDLGGLRLHLADDVTETLWESGSISGDDDPPLPFWAFAWAGGLAIARFLLDHPEEVAGRAVLDVASGSGLCAIAAVRAGAASVLAVDVDPLSEAAVAINARANGIRVRFTRRDVRAVPLPDVDVVLAGDVAYEETMAARMFAWLREAAERGVRVLIGDPGRSYLPRDLERIASYPVRTTRELEASEVTESAVYTFPRRSADGARQARLPNE